MNDGTNRRALGRIPRLIIGKIGPVKIARIGSAKPSPNEATLCQQPHDYFRHESERVMRTMKVSSLSGRRIFVRFHASIWNGSLSGPFM